MFNIRFVVAFAAVVEEGSFTRATQRLNTSQSWVSEQVSKLEEQVGFQLLARTSRKVELTAKGEVFSRLALDLVRSSNALETYVRSTQAAQQGHLRIGSAVTFAELPQRGPLIEGFMRRHGRVEVEITYENQQVLLDRLRRLELDVLMGFDMGVGLPDDLDVLPVAILDSYVLIPREDPAARLEVLPQEALSGRAIVTVPRSSGGPMIDHLVAELEAWDITWSPAPEDDRRAVERYASMRRVSSLRWRPPGQHRREVGDMVQLPMERPVRIAAVIARNRNLASRNTERLWRIAQELAEAPPLVG